MLKPFIILNLCLIFAFTVHGKLLKRVEQGDGVVKAFAYKENGGDVVTLCALYYNHLYPKTGWDIVQVETNPAVQTDAEQAECAGEIESFVTYKAIYIHYYNNVRNWCKNRKQTCAKVYDFVKKHYEWVQESIKKKADHDPMWYHVNIFYQHVVGLYTGYSEMQHDPDKKLTMQDFLLMNLQDDLEDVAAAMEGDTGAKVRGDSRCSAIVKLIPYFEDLLVGHNTWTSYTQMYRMLKMYNIPVNTSTQSQTAVPGYTISFSGYPGVITSGDDFYTTSAGLVAQETTIGNNNASLWQYVKPTGQLFESVRSTIALRLANNGRSWCETFSGYNSGTYNNQWMVVDFNKFQQGQPPQDGLLWVLEQIPNYVRFEDQTAVLVHQTYWPSYNIPFYRDVFNMSGNQELVDKYGDWFSYNNTPRALIFRRDHTSVVDVESLLTLLRSNDYTNDPYAKCNCTPPYSAENAIAARSDLNPKAGTYPFPALGHRPHGAIDAKATSAVLARNMTFLAVCGPTTGNNLPPFRWNNSTFKHLPHVGQPNSFEHFSPYLRQWLGPFL